jgi:hypothetical protein
MTTLDTLPLEIQFEIFSYLLQPLSSHAGISPVPVTYEEQQRIEHLRHDRVQLMRHPYNHLAATCQQLRSSVEAYLKGHHRRSKVPKAPKDDWNTAVAIATAKGIAPKLPLAYRNRYLKSTFKKCIFCGKQCKRRAAFNRFMWCDLKCDTEQFGRLIVSSTPGPSSLCTANTSTNVMRTQSKSEATSKHKVLEIHWRTPQLIFPESAWKPLRMTLYNTSPCSSTTLLRERDVLELANYIKAHDPRGEKLKLARKRIRDKAHSDEAKAMLKAEEEFMKFAGAWLSDLATDQPSQEDCAKAASLLRAMVQNQILLLNKESFNQAAAKKRLFEKLPAALSPYLRKFCKVEILHQDDMVVYRFGICRPATLGDSRAGSLYIPILIECDSRRGAWR